MVCGYIISKYLHVVSINVKHGFIYDYIESIRRALLRTVSQDKQLLDIGVVFIYLTMTFIQEDHNYL